MPQMIEIEDVVDRVAYDEDTGFFTWAKHPNPASIGNRAEHKGGAEGYLLVWKVRAHRLAWRIAYGAWPSNEIDHIDGDRLNNSISNLRDVTKQWNMQNQRQAQTKNKSSGMLGVSWHKSQSKWRAIIRLDGKQHHVGYFPTADQAHTAYVERKRLMHPGCTI